MKPKQNNKSKLKDHTVTVQKQATEKAAKDAGEHQFLV